jgi:hypothetical protein
MVALVAVDPAGDNLVRAEWIDDTRVRLDDHLALTNGRITWRQAPIVLEGRNWRRTETVERAYIVHEERARSLVITYLYEVSFAGAGDKPGGGRRTGAVTGLSIISRGAILGIRQKELILEGDVLVDMGDRPYFIIFPEATLARSTGYELLIDQPGVGAPVSDPPTETGDVTCTSACVGLKLVPAMSEVLHNAVAMYIYYDREWRRRARPDDRLLFMLGVALIIGIATGYVPLSGLWASGLPWAASLGTIMAYRVLCSDGSSMSPSPSLQQYRDEHYE